MDEDQNGEISSDEYDDGLGRIIRLTCEDRTDLLSDSMSFGKLGEGGNMPLVPLFCGALAGIGFDQFDNNRDKVWQKEEYRQFAHTINSYVDGPVLDLN